LSGLFICRLCILWLAFFLYFCFVCVVFFFWFVVFFFFFVLVFVFFFFFFFCHVCLTVFQFCSSFGMFLPRSPIPHTVDYFITSPERHDTHIRLPAYFERAPTSSAHPQPSHATATAPTAPPTTLPSQPSLIARPPHTSAHRPTDVYGARARPATPADGRVVGPLAVFGFARVRFVCCEIFFPNRSPDQGQTPIPRQPPDAHH